MADMSEIIRTHIQKEFMYDRPGVELNDDYPLIGEGVIDSLGLLNMISFLEGEFGIKIGDDEIVLENFETVTRIRSLVEDKLAHKA